MKRLLTLLAVAVIGLAATSVRADPIGDPEETDSWAQLWDSDSWDKGAVWFQYYMHPGLDTSTVDPNDVDRFRATAALTSFTSGRGWKEVFHNSVYGAASGPAMPQPTTQKPNLPDDWLRYNINFEGANKTNALWISYQSYDASSTRLCNVDYFYTGATGKIADWSWTSSNGGSWEANAPIPEPLSMAFLASALVGVVGVRLRQRRKQA